MQKNHLGARNQEIEMQILYLEIEKQQFEMLAVHLINKFVVDQIQGVSHAPARGQVHSLYGSLNFFFCITPIYQLAVYSSVFIRLL